MSNNKFDEDFCGYWRGVKKTPEEIEILSKAVGDAYRSCRTRKIYEEDLALVTIVDLSLENCSRVSQLIIRKEFLEVSDKKWFLEFFSKSTFYRNRKKAMKEFIENLIIDR